MGRGALPHPRVVLRLGDSISLELVQLLATCEVTSQWPKCIRLIVVALLPKPDGGFRPIGLAPWLPRVWTRARRSITLQWERLHSRHYFYAAEAKGATVTAWQQAARAELASALQGRYGQAL